MSTHSFSEDEMTELEYRLEKMEAQVLLLTVEVHALAKYISEQKEANDKILRAVTKRDPNGS